MIHCLHGSAGCHSNWNIFKESFGEEIKPVDLWSLLDQDEVTLEDAGKQIADSADCGDILLGYSLGGRLALHALLHDPEKWRAAVVIAANPGISEGHSERIASDEKWARLAESDWQEFLKQWNRQPLLSSPPEISRAFQHAPEARRHKVAQSFHDWSLGRQRDLRPALPKVSCPVLWITGAQDKKFTSIAESSVPRIPRGRMVILPDAGHRLPWQEPEIFAGIVKDFVAAPETS